MLDVNEHQMPNHPSTFMEMIKGRANEMSAANSGRHPVLNPHVIWDGGINRSKVLRNSNEGHYGKTQYRILIWQGISDYTL
jgi:hypothetical protein